MYCPQCSQEQVAGELRFCPNCGMPMGLVAEVLANGGTLPQLLELSKKNKIFTRRNGIVFSVLWFIFFVPFMAAFWGGVFGQEELAAFFAIVGVFSSLLIFLVSLFFLPGPSKGFPDHAMAQNENAIPTNLSGQKNQQNALPPQQTQPAQEYVSPASSNWKAPDTGELARPGSVTEGTTKLLQKDE